MEVERFASSRRMKRKAVEKFLKELEEEKAKLELADESEEYDEYEQEEWAK